MIAIMSFFSIFFGIWMIYNRKKNPLDDWGQAFGSYIQGALFIIFGFYWLIKYSF